MSQLINKKTRGAIFAAFGVYNLAWHGNRSTVQFLSKLYDLHSMPSTDVAFTSAHGDITHNTIRKKSWPPDWIFTDPRFRLMTCSDEAFLEFLCYTIHPEVRSLTTKTKRIVSDFNTALKTCGFKLAVFMRIGSQPVYAGLLIEPLVPKTKESRKALVIGCGRYPGAAALPNPSNDVIDIVKKLQRLKFTVTSIIDKGSKSMSDGITEFTSSLSRNDIVVIYYAGHAVQLPGGNFILPIDAVVKNQLVAGAAISINGIMGRINDRRVSLTIAILDACRDNPIKKGRRGLQPIEPDGNFIIGYATGYNKTASDGSGRNGLYTDALLTHIGTKSLPVAQMFLRVTEDVNYHNKAQKPVTHISSAADFYFNK